MCLGTCASVPGECRTGPPNLISDDENSLDDFVQVDISLYNISLCQSDLSDIDQLDGNTSLNSRPKNRRLIQNASVAHHLPVVSVCNMRSLFPKVSNFKIDFFERSVDFSLCCEVWEKAESKYHMSEIEKMF